MTGMTPLEYVTVVGSILGGLAAFGLIVIRLQFAPGPLVAHCPMCGTVEPARPRRRKHRARRWRSTMVLVAGRVAAVELTRAVAATTARIAASVEADTHLRPLRAAPALPAVPQPVAITASPTLASYDLLAAWGAPRVPRMRLPHLDHRTYRDTVISPTGEWEPVYAAPGEAGSSRLVACATAVAE
jgi:hypothetical protein